MYNNWSSLCSINWEWAAEEILYFTTVYNQSIKKINLASQAGTVSMVYITHSQNGCAVFMGSISRSLFSLPVLAHCWGHSLACLSWVSDKGALTLDRHYNTLLSPTQAVHQHT